MTILAVCLVRGIGLAIMFVASGALVAILVPPDRRGEGLGLMGVVSLIPAVLGLPLGLWLADHAGYSAVFVTGAAVSLVGLAAVPSLPNRQSESEDAISLSQALRSPTLLRLSGVFAGTTVAAGAIVTFLPLAVTSSFANLAALALFIHSGASTLARWWAGRYGDRHGAERLLVPGVLISGIGIFLLVLTAIPVSILIGMLCFGIGFGLIQNATLALMFERAPAGYGAVSAIWSVAYDAGLGLGGAGFGVIATQTGYPPAFAITAALTLCAIVPAIQNRTWRSRHTVGR
jgi:predicted MFS family arabinose efflux permease